MQNPTRCCQFVFLGTISASNQVMMTMGCMLNKTTIRCGSNLWIYYVNYLYVCSIKCSTSYIFFKPILSFSFFQQVISIHNGIRPGNFGIGEKSSCKWMRKCGIFQRVFEAMRVHDPERFRHGLPPAWPRSVNKERVHSSCPLCYYTFRRIKEVYMRSDLVTGKIHRINVGLASCEAGPTFTWSIWDLWDDVLGFPKQTRYIQPMLG